MGVIGKMPFPTLELLDSFKRPFEEPLSNGGKWKTFHPINNTTGYLSGTDWENYLAGKVEGAYWSPIEFSNPGVAIERDRRTKEDSGYWSLWACISNPTTAEISGYRLKMTFTAANLFEVKLERCDKNSFTVLSTTLAEAFNDGDRIGLAVQGGKVQYWRKKGAEAWEERASAADVTYTKGYVGFAVEAADGDTANFEAGSGEGGVPTVENPGTQHTRKGKEVAFKIHATNATHYAATGLPAGLAINESTGEITGTPTTVESPLVKVTVENEAKETATMSFEWVIFEGCASLLGMIIG